MNIKINFNNIRKQAVQEYNDLIKILNAGICTDKDMDRVIVPVDDLEDVLRKLGMSIGYIAMTYDDNNPDLQCVLDDAAQIETFNKWKD